LGWDAPKANESAVYDVHVPLSASDLAAAHVSAGLEVIKCEYFLDVNWNVVNLEGSRWKRLSRWRFERFLSQRKRSGLSRDAGACVLTGGHPLTSSVQRGGLQDFLAASRV
jgi:hypothetical protein